MASEWLDDPIHIREARSGEAEDLSDVAYRSKGYWGYNPETLDQWAGPLTITEEYLEANPTFVAYEEDDEERILGFCALLCDQGRWELDHMWVIPEAIGRGIGARLFLRACEEAELLGASSLWILSDPSAEGFYKHMGAVRIDQQTTVVDGTERILPILSIRLTTEGPQDLVPHDPA